MSTAASVASLNVRMVPLDQIAESIHNPRRHFTPSKLAELEASIREVGVLTPLLAREADGMYELAAGHRRFRAAKSAGLDQVPVRVVELTDTQLLEVLTIENLQREDVHPLDEARGYVALMRADRVYTAKAIAAKVGKSESYVYRRLKLLELNPDLRELFERDAITAAHAERLARLDDHLQTEALEEPGVLFLAIMTSDDNDHIAENVAPLSALDNFIRRRTAVDPASPDVQHYFPEIAEAIDDAQTSGATLLELSMDYFVRQKLGVDASAPAPIAKPKWHEVSTKKDRCATTVRGVITHGGEMRALDVCATKGCPKHFPAPKPSPAKPAGQKVSSATKEDSWEERRRKEQEQQERWETMRARLYPLLVAHLEAQTLTLTVDLVRQALSDVAGLEETYGVTLSTKNIPLFLALEVIGDNHWNVERFRQAVKPFNFDWRAAEKQVAAELRAAQAKETPAKSAAKKAKKKGKAA